MKTIKTFLSIITIIFAALGFASVLSFNIAGPIMLTSLATLLLLISLECKKSGNKSGFILNCLTAVFVYIVVIYTVFIG